MKDLLEVIEDGREEMEDIAAPKIGYEHDEGEWMLRDIDGSLTRPVHTKDLDSIIDHLTSHTKTILTNQIERMKGAQKEGDCGRCHACELMMSCDYRAGRKAALQTQIDYLEDVLKKLDNN